MTCGPDLWTQLVDTTHGPDLCTRLLVLTRGPDTWNLKNKELLRIGLVDRPRMGGVQLVDRPRMEP